MLRRLRRTAPWWATLATTAALGTWLLALPHGPSSLPWTTWAGAADPAGLLLWLAEAALLVVLLRLAAAAALALVACAVGGVGAGTLLARSAVRCSPALLRPFMASALSLSVTLTAAGAADAAVGASPAAPRPASTVSRPGSDLPAAAWRGSPAVPPRALPAAGWRPAAPATAPAVAPGPPELVTSAASRRGVDDGSDQVVVRPGECLWSIVARHLGPRTSDSRIAAEWPRWWSANRAVIGEDPDLLRPGTRLTVPATRTTGSTSRPTAARGLGARR